MLLYVRQKVRNMKNGYLECQFALVPGQDIEYVHYMMMSGRRFLETEDREDSAAGHSQRTYFVEPSA